MVEISRRLRGIADNLEMSRAAPEDTSLSPALGGPPLEALGPLTADAVSTARTAARRFLLLDLRRVTGIDATTATSFASLSRALSNRCAHSLAHFVLLRTLLPAEFCSLLHLDSSSRSKAATSVRLSNFVTVFNNQ